MRIGFGTGSTAAWFIAAVCGRVRDEGLRVRAIATSTATERLLRDGGVAVSELGAEGLDLAVDGADAVDGDLRLIKGLGGALVREKVVAAAAARYVVVVDASKVCERLSGRVPVEVLPFGADSTLAHLQELEGTFSWRTSVDGTRTRSDNGNLLCDGVFDLIDDPEGLAARLDAVPGVIGHGLFLGMTDQVLVGDSSGGVRVSVAPGEGASAG